MLRRALVAKLLRDLLSGLSRENLVRKGTELLVRVANAISRLM